MVVHTGMARRVYQTEVRLCFGFSNASILTCTHVSVLLSVCILRLQHVGFANSVCYSVACLCLLRAQQCMSAIPLLSYFALFHSWMAPESFFDGVWDVRSDVWMFGVYLWGKVGYVLMICVDDLSLLSWIAIQSHLALDTQALLSHVFTQSCSGGLSYRGAELPTVM